MDRFRAQQNPYHFHSDKLLVSDFTEMPYSASCDSLPSPLVSFGFSSFSSARFQVNVTV